MPLVSGLQGIERGHCRLTEAEGAWADLYNYLLGQGYQLRPRYRPGWKPSWDTEEFVSPAEHEDFIIAPVRGARL